MDVNNTSGIIDLKSYDYKDKYVLLRVDINSPIDPKSKRIVNENRIVKSIPTIEYLLDHGAKLAIIAHQGDTLDYQNLIPMKEHAEKLTALLGIQVAYIDDVCGPAAQRAVMELKAGEAILLGNLRYLCEEISTFEDAVKLKPEEMLDTYLVRSLAPLMDLYVNDAFAAAHRNCPSMVAFQEILPSVGGILMVAEINALVRVIEQPEKPSVFVLGGAKISDAFGMMKQVLENGTADKILVGGVVGEVMLMASGIDIGSKKEKFIKDRNLDAFVPAAKEYLKDYRHKIVVPIDLAFEQDGKRTEIDVREQMPDEMYMDIGAKTTDLFKEIIEEAGTIFVNGPSGAYENKLFQNSTAALWECIADAKGYSVIGGGDTVSAAAKFVQLGKLDYVCTAGGAMVQFLSGKELPLVEAMKKCSKKA